MNRPDSEDKNKKDKRRRLLMPRIPRRGKRQDENKPSEGRFQQALNEKSRKSGDQQVPPPKWRKLSKTFLFWMLIVMIFIAVTKFFDSDPQQFEIDYSEYKELLLSGMIAELTIIDAELHGVLKEDYEPTESYEPGVEKIKRHYENRFVVNIGIVDSDTIKEWVKWGVVIKFEEKSSNWLGVVLQIFPWFIFFGVWLFLLRQMQGGPKGLFSFGKSKAKLVAEDKPKVTFKDVAGADEAKQELEEIIEFLKDPKKFQRFGGRIPKGVLLVGPPGTGKTYMAKAVAGEAEVPFFSMSGSDFVEMFVGVGASRVRDLFDQGKNNAPCIIFIDELDAVGRHRGAGIGGGHDEREQTLNQLLVEMDGFNTNEGVILIAATNRPDVLDPALLRPGRFDRHVVVERPDVKGREGILRVHTRLKHIPLAKGVNLKVLARGTPGLSGADLENLVNEAALLASKRNRKNVTTQDFEDSKDKVMMGAERRSLVISDEEKKLIAYHEVGHSLVAKLIPGSDPVHKVTIIPRGKALGVTHFLPIDEKHTYSKTYCLGKIAHVLGGRVAEKIVFGEMSTGSGNDYEQATNLARNMVCEWGMSDRLGPITYGKKEEEIFLGREIAKRRDYSEKTAQIIDEEVEKLVTGAEKKVEQLLRDNIDKMHTLAETLLELEVLDGSQIDRVLAGEDIRKVRSKQPRRRGSTPSRTNPSRSRTSNQDGKSSERSPHSDSKDTQKGKAPDSKDKDSQDGREREDVSTSKEQPQNR